MTSITYHNHYSVNIFYKSLFPIPGKSHLLWTYFTLDEQKCSKSIHFNKVQQSSSYLLDSLKNLKFKLILCFKNVLKQKIMDANVHLTALPRNTESRYLRSMNNQWWRLKKIKSIWHMESCKGCWDFHSNFSGNINQLGKYLNVSISKVKKARTKSWPTLLS